MEIIHSGFDSLYFSIQGSLSANAVKHYEGLKALAVQQDANEAFHVKGHSNRYHMHSTGKKGGYTYLIDTGRVGSSIAFKSSLARNQHNGFVEISSACLLAYGWREAVSQALEHVQALGFHVVDISINRVDYCIDFLDAQIVIDPRDFVAHARSKKQCYLESTSVTEHVERQTNHVQVRTVSQADTIKSITIGKMPGRQVIVYDKRAEVIERRKFYWFDAWGIDRHDATRTVHRVEVRAGKSHLKGQNITTLDDFERYIGHVLIKAVEVNRWIDRPHETANVTRAELHPVWEMVQTHITHALAPYTAPITPEVITDRIRQNKRIEYRQQIIGNLGGYLGCEGVPYEDIPEELKVILKDVTDSLSMDAPNPMRKSYLRAKERWH